MRSDRRALLLALALTSACDEKPTGPPAERFAAVKKGEGASAKKFCEKTYPATGAEARKFDAPLRAFEGDAKFALGPKGTYVNVWATWCKPCVEEMALLGRWRDALAREGRPVGFELLSVDHEDNLPELQKWRQKSLPGPIRWLRKEEDLEPFLASLGVEKSAGLPIHILVDGAGMVRCVRVGAIHEQDYGAVKDLLAGG